MVSEPFMPIAQVTDDMLIDTGTEIITFGELTRRDEAEAGSFPRKGPQRPPSYAPPAGTPLPPANRD